MMMVDHIVALVRSQNHRDHVPAEKLALLFVWLVLAPVLSQALALFLHLPHSNGHLGWMQREDRNRLKDRFTRIRHDLESLSDGQKSLRNSSAYGMMARTIKPPLPAREERWSRAEASEQRTRRQTGSLNR